MTSEITAGFVETFLTTLDTMLGTSSASRYSQFTDVLFTNAGSTNLKIAVLPDDYPSAPVAADFITVAAGDSIAIPSLNSAKTYIATDDDAGTNVLQFNGEV